MLSLLKFLKSLGLNYFLIKNKKGYFIKIYNNNYYLQVFLKKLEKRIFFEKRIFLKFITQFYFYTNTKIKFKGKGYKIKKFKKNCINFKFNKSHIEYLRFKNFFFKKLRKNKYLIKYNYIISTHLIWRVLAIRRVNIFTLRGLRKSSQVLLKKKGKK